MDFTKIREMRNQNKREVSRASIGNEKEFIASASNSLNTSNIVYQHAHYHQTQHSPTIRFLGQICNALSVSYYYEETWNNHKTSSWYYINKIVTPPHNIGIHVKHTWNVPLYDRTW
ncbi:Pathogenic type III effector avirulence factor Avr cleavage site-containing protein [Quillaja saponaria]|uniref:Pathogenic type III effector avirulence factor Avr cleavage site-containing protein n=1 Tax=Quillaja saponaria TaxID=32244 RepID=A0AAD7PXP6_QUISA|nr:Pathogenic type III effector avirulence factor Avr cleavage site-containing protein [Quillaja saponaria]